MTALLRPLLGAALLALGSTLSLAQTATPPAPAEVSKSDTSADDAEGGKAAQSRLAACRADIAKLCPDAKGSKRNVCLKDNTAKLTPECATAYADVEAKAKAMRDACAEDVKTHCKGVKGPAQCLRTNSSKLSPACSIAVEARFGKG